MKATTLSVCTPSNECNKNCPYCISKMTGEDKIDVSLMERALPKVKALATRAEINTVIFTGKGEPLLEWDFLLQMLAEFDEFPCGLQTNGLLLCEGTIDELAKSGLNILAISIDKSSQFHKYSSYFEHAKRAGLVTRATIALTDMLAGWTLTDYIDSCKENSIDQLSFRQVTIPNFGIADTRRAKKVEKWIKSHVNEKHHKSIIKELKSYKSHTIRSLPYGAKVIDIEGIAVAYFDYCIQDSTNMEDIRSLIFKSDGHLYTSWNSNASILL